jgi:hypothetical protein
MLVVQEDGTEHVRAPAAGGFGWGWASLGGARRQAPRARDAARPHGSRSSRRSCRSLTRAGENVISVTSRDTPISTAPSRARDVSGNARAVTRRCVTSSGSRARDSRRPTSTFTTLADSIGWASSALVFCRAPSPKLSSATMWDLKHVPGGIGRLPARGRSPRTGPIVFWPTRPAPRARFAPTFGPAGSAARSPTPSTGRPTASAATHAADG